MTFQTSLKIKYIFPLLLKDLEREIFSFADLDMLEIDVVTLTVNLVTTEVLHVRNAQFPNQIKTVATSCQDFY